MYKKIIAIIILSFFFILSCAKENPNNPNNSGNVSGGGGDTGGSTGDGGDEGQNHPSLSKYAGVWEGDNKIHVFAENYYIRKMNISSGPISVLFITNITSLSDNEYKVYYKKYQSELDVTISFVDDNNGHIKGLEKNYFNAMNKDYTLKKIPQTLTGIDKQYAGQYSTTSSKQILIIKDDGSIEYYNDINGKIMFSIDASKISKKSEISYESYWHTNICEGRETIAEMTLDFNTDGSCSFHSSFNFIDKYEGSSSYGSDKYVKQK